MELAARRVMDNQTTGRARAHLSYGVTQTTAELNLYKPGRGQGLLCPRLPNKMFPPHSTRKPAADGTGDPHSCRGGFMSLARRF